MATTIQYWKSDNPNYQAERKAEWKNVKRTLSRIDHWVPRSAHKYHKELFFEGEFLTYMERRRRGISDPFEGGLLFYLTWYCADDCLEGLDKFYDQTDLREVAQTRERFFSLRPVDFPEDYGMCGGREKLLVEKLVPSYDYKSVIKRGGLEFAAGWYADRVADKCIGGTCSLLKNRGINPFSPAQYLWNHFAFNSGTYPDTFLSTDWQKTRYEKLMGLILGFYDVEDSLADRPTVKLLRDTLYERYEARDFPDNMMKYWDEAKVRYENS